MAAQLTGAYFPMYPHHDVLPDPEIRTFITNFYSVSDRADRNELWISHFTKDAEVLIGNDGGKGEQEIRELRSRMWASVTERQHSVTKVFPARFRQQDDDDGDQGECECMLFGEVRLRTRDGGVQAAVVPWAGHAVLVKVRDGERDGWKFRHYRVWMQK